MFESGSTAVLLWGLLFGSIGFGFFIYGKKQKAVVPLVTGIALCVVPYFIANVYALVVAGVILIVIPFVMVLTEATRPGPFSCPQQF